MKEQRIEWILEELSWRSKEEQIKFLKILFEAEHKKDIDISSLQD